MKSVLTILATALLFTACAHTPQAPAAQIQVYKSDGARQCEGGGIAPEIMLKELDGIHVYAARKQLMQGVMVPAVCGGTTGSINVYNIAAEDQAAAEQRGFAVLPPRKNKNPIFQ